MKIFAVYARVELVEKPAWLDEFRAKYGAVHEYHVTLVQPRYIDESQADGVRRACERVVRAFSSPTGEMTLAFDEFNAGKGDDSSVADGCIMINARATKENEPIFAFQRAMREEFASNEKYADMKRREYEYNFHPHITVAMNLDRAKYDAAMAEWKPDFRSVGRISEIVCPVVPPENLDVPPPASMLTVFRL